MKARDIMTRELVIARPDMGIEEVAGLLLRHGISGLPVVDAAGRLVGMVTEADLLARTAELDLPAFFPLLGGVIWLEHPRRFEEQLRKATATRVEDVMSREVLTVDEDTPVREIATLMVKKEINRVPVVRGGRPVGIVAREDIVRAVSLDVGS